MTELATRPREELMAAEIRHRYNLGHEKIDPFEVARLLGLHVVRYPVQNGSIEGQYRPFPDGGGAIFVNSATVNLRQRFTAAHEIGHAMLHAKRAVVEVGSEMFSQDPMEKQANRFAGALLIDRSRAEAILERWSGDVDPAVAEIVETFVVSPETAIIALQQFALITGREANAFQNRYADMSHRDFMVRHHRQPQYRSGSGSLKLDRAYERVIHVAYAKGQISAERAAMLLEKPVDDLPKWATRERARIDAEAEAAAQPILEL